MNSKQNPRFERWAVAALLGLLALAARLEVHSPITAQRRSHGSLFIWLTLRRSAAPPAPTEQFLFAYHWKEQTLDIVELPPSPHDKPVQDILDRMVGNAYRLDRTIPASSPWGGPGLRRRLLDERRRGGFWIRLPGALRTLRRDPDWADLSIYDFILLALEYYRLDARSIRPILVSSAQISTLPRLEARLRGLAPSVGAADPSQYPGEGPITAEVRNASQSPGIALQATKLLRWRGIDVVDFGNHPVASDTTFVFDRTGDPEPARFVAEALGCSDAEIVTQIDASRHAMTSVVLGRDFGRCLALTHAPVEQPQEARP
ncbi:MAG: LytR C-terminal domain-containing protein [Elusimicrobia bacterium]|nr:LytR C-terminal domain-containing protein [Elusimicrobiota bacterium]